MPYRLRRANRPIPVLRGDWTLLKVGASRFDLHDPYHLAVSLSWPAFAVALLAAWLTVNLIFASLYVLGPGAVANAAPGSFSDAFFFSVETLATVGYGVMAPATTYGHIVSTMEIVTGTVFTAIFTGLLFVRFSRPKAKIVYADQAVVTAHNGQHTLMVRLANGRMTLMTNANVRLFVLLAQTSEEGTLFRRIHELPLIQSHLPLFVMPWTLMHAIDEASPLHQYGDANALAAADARVFLTLEARDQAMAAVVNDMKSYEPAHICFGMRYADAVRMDDAGQIIADLTRISLIEPDAGTDPDWTRWAR